MHDRNPRTNTPKIKLNKRFLPLRVQRSSEFRVFIRSYSHCQSRSAWGIRRRSVLGESASVCERAAEFSHQAEAFVLLDGAREPQAQRLSAPVARQVQQVVAGVSDGQEVLVRRRGLDDDAQAGHAVDGDPVTACEEH